MPNESAINAEIKELQRARARRTRGSRRWNHHTRQLRRVYEHRSHRRDDAQRHIAQALAGTPGLRAVGAENTNNAAMTASASGTTAHPGTNVAAKRGLNRALSDRRYAGVRSAVERACTKAGIHYVLVAAAGTSSLCHSCGEQGIQRDPSRFQMPQLQMGGQRRHQFSTPSTPTSLRPLQPRTGRTDPAAGTAVARRSAGMKTRPTPQQGCSQGRLQKVRAHHQKEPSYMSPSDNPYAIEEGRQIALKKSVEARSARSNLRAKMRAGDVSPRRPARASRRPGCGPHEDPRCAHRCARHRPPQGQQDPGRGRGHGHQAPERPRGPPMGHPARPRRVAPGTRAPRAPVGRAATDEHP